MNTELVSTGWNIKVELTELEAHAIIEQIRRYDQMLVGEALHVPSAFNNLRAALLVAIDQIHEPAD